MHPSAMLHARAFFRTYAGDVGGGRIIETGSQDVNGSLREMAPPHLENVGVDFVPGKGVDVIFEVPFRLPFDDASAEIVVTSSCFEHSEMFWLLFLKILRILKPNGLLYLNVPSNGDYHRYPVDCWRFYSDSGHALVRWAEHNRLQPALLESFIGGKTGRVWNDFVAVFLKDRARADQYRKRITDGGGSFVNAHRLGDGAPSRVQQVSLDQSTPWAHLKRRWWTRREGKLMKAIRRAGP